MFHYILSFFISKTFTNFTSIKIEINQTDYLIIQITNGDCMIL